MTLVLARAVLRAWRRHAQIEFHHLQLHHGRRTTDDRATDHQDGKST